MYTLNLTKEELDFVRDRCSRKIARLEEAHLEDIPCYKLAWQVLGKVNSAQSEATEDTQYYVIQNLETGLYFRGKGVNRWGKYLNQASVYRVKGQAESSCEEINRRHREGERAVVVPIKIKVNDEI